MHRALIAVAVLICIGLSVVFLIRGAPDDPDPGAASEPDLYSEPEPGPGSIVQPAPEAAPLQPPSETAAPAMDTVPEGQTSRAPADDPAPAEPYPEPAGIADTVGDAVDPAPQAVVETVEEADPQLVPETDTPAEPALGNVIEEIPDTPAAGSDTAGETADRPAESVAEPPDWAELLSVETFDADALIAAIEASDVSRVTRRAAIAALEAARETPELRDMTLNQVRTLLGLR